VIVARPSGPLARAVGNLNWQRVYVDRSYAIFARPGLYLPLVDLHDRVVTARFP
jgi:hypothetical protein